MAAAVSRREISPVELVRDHLQRIEALQPKLRAFVRVFAGQALAAAESVPYGALQGVPVTIKDSFDLAGFPTLCGSRFRLGHTAQADSTAAARLKAAGAIILGKTSCPEFLANYETDSHISGPVANPWNLARTAGGSSGGEAAAIASFCSAGGVGSDGGGSIRLPAHFCGICGLKPTPGRVSAAGHFPECGYLGGMMGAAGPMARTIGDLDLLFRVLAGYDPADPLSAPVPIREPVLEGMRIGVVERWGGEPLDSAVREALLKAAGLLAAEPVELDGFEEWFQLWRFFFTLVPKPLTRDRIEGGRDTAHWTGLELYDEIAHLPDPTGRQIVEKLAQRDAVRRKFLDTLRQYPVLLTPVSSTVAFPHRQRPQGGLLEWMRPMVCANLFGLPALTLPMTLSDDGLPCGVQLIGPPYGEEMLLGLARRLEHARGRFPAPPSLQ
jgi:amidase